MQDFFNYLCYNIKRLEVLKMVKELESLLDKDLYLVSNLSNAAALFNMLLDDINWVGFYLAKENELILGPFQGKVACTIIKYGKGVVGTAALNKTTLVVPNVHEFSGHIACDSASNSEICIPLFSNGKLQAILDIDSTSFNRFEKISVELEECAKIMEEKIDWNKI